VRVQYRYYHYYYSTRRCRELTLASRGGTNVTIFGITISTKFTIGVSQRDKSNANYSICMYSTDIMTNTTVDVVRGFLPQNLMVSSSYLMLFILLFVYTVVCIFAGMYYNTAAVCFCQREVCQGSISCRHVQ